MILALANRKLLQHYLPFYLFVFITECFDVFIRFQAFASSRLWTILKRYVVNTFKLYLPTSTLFAFTDWLTD